MGPNACPTSFILSKKPNAVPLSFEISVAKGLVEASLIEAPNEKSIAPEITKIKELEREVWKIAERLDKNLLTAAEFLGMKPKVLEV